MQKVTAMDVKEALSEYHGYKEFFITECKNGSTYFPQGQGLLKFDGLAINKSWTNPKITIYEIKVSRGDFLQDGKWHLYLQYCHEFYFVVPKGLIKKTEVPDNVGLMYYDPDKKSIRKVKKAFYKADTEMSAELLMYIIMNKLDSDRIPFYGNNRLQYAKDYLTDKKDRRNVGYCFGSEMAKDIAQMQKELDLLKHSKEDLDLLHDIKEVLKKHKIVSWWRDDLVEKLDEELSRTYPKELDDLKVKLVNAIKYIDETKQSLEM